MKLYITRTSPYARVVRVMALERGLAQRLQAEIVATRVPDSVVNDLNPTGKVPTLETPEGVILSEAKLICQYLDALHEQTPVVDPAASLPLRGLEGVVTGFLDGLAVWVRELRRPEKERSPGILEQERARSERVLTYLELHADWREDVADYPRICLAVALDLLTHGIGQPRWGEQYPGVRDWYRRFAARPSMLATDPYGG
jgi:glutathione S-transferase